MLIFCNSRRGSPQTAGVGCFADAPRSGWTDWSEEEGGLRYLQIPSDTWTLLEPLLATMMS